jgi:hypothetical protein
VNLLKDSWKEKEIKNLSMKFLPLRKNLGAFLALCAKNRAIRSNLFYRFAVKKDFRFYPLRGSECMGGQRMCVCDFAATPPCENRKSAEHLLF